ncbi:MAG: acyl carrier protein [Halioglobus sp.]|jgi:acyl carrier protein
MSNFEKLQDIMATSLELPANSIKQDSTMEQIEEWDSLGHVHIMVALEEAFDLYMDVEDFAELDSVAAILKFLDAEGAG